MAETKIGVKNRDMEVNRDDENVKAMQDFTSPDVLYKELIASVHKYHPSTDISMIEKAYKIASEAHQGQLRKSGEPYIIHPLCVAIILADLELDKETIVAGLLHDAVEDTVMTTEEIAEKFVKVTGTVEPEPELVAKYEDRYQKFRQIYPACRPLFEIIK